MNIQVPLALLPSLLFMIFCFIPTFVILWIFKRQTAKKKSPLNVDLLRSPGESLKDQLQDITNDISMSLVQIPISSLLFYSIAVTQIISSEDKPNLLSLFICVATVVILVPYLIIRVLRLMKQRNHLRLGYECELAVGQELNNRMREGFYVFHDFPADEFNIDHVLVGATGVFAIETKGRAKSRVAEKENWKMEFDGKKLIFPGWTETKPITQAKNQAQWLSGWLQKATGASCRVESVLAIPGWWIKRTASSDMKVYNGKNSEFLAKGKVVLTPPQIQAISHQIEQKCRTVSSSSYKQEN